MHCTIEHTFGNKQKNLSTEFPGCKEGYPVKFGSPTGGHQGSVTENSVNWIAQEIWNIFKQF